MCCFVHTANTLAYFKKIFLFQKYILPWNFKRKKMYFSMDFAKKNYFLHFEILQHVCKIQRVLANIPKIVTSFFGLLFTVDIWINKS